MKVVLYYNQDTKKAIVAEKTELKYQLIQEDTEVDDDVIKVSPKTVEQQITHLDREILVIDSVKSGVGRDKFNIFGDILNPVFDDLGIKAKYIETTSPDSIKEIGESLEGKDYLVLLISGDTSINEFVNGVSNNNNIKSNTADITIANIPLGTGNSFSLSLGIENDLQAVAKLFRGIISPLNLYTAELPKGSYIISQNEKIRPIEKVNFLIVLSWGFHASLVADSDTPELRRFGLERFKIAAKNNLECHQEYPGTTIIGDNNKTIAGPYAYWLITPSQRFEPQFNILPLGDLLTPNLYFVGFNSEHSTDNNKYIMDIMMEVYNNGSHIHNEKVKYELIPPDQSTTLKLKQLTGFNQRRICIDGFIVLLPEIASDEIKIIFSGSKVGNWNLSILR